MHVRSCAAGQTEYPLQNSSCSLTALRWGKRWDLYEVTELGPALTSGLRLVCVMDPFSCSVSRACLPSSFNYGVTKDKGPP